MSGSRHTDVAPLMPGYSRPSFHVPVKGRVEGCVAMRWSRTCEWCTIACLYVHVEAEDNLKCHPNMLKPLRPKCSSTGKLPLRVVSKGGNSIIEGPTCVSHWGVKVVQCGRLSTGISTQAGDSKTKMRTLRAEETGSALRALVALPGDLDLIPSNQMMMHKHL